MGVRQTKWSRRAILTSGLLSTAVARWGTASAKELTQSSTHAVRVKLDAIGRTVEAETRAGRATGVSISVAVKGAIVWESGFGFECREKPRPATAHTPFSLASLTKPFTTAAVMRLVQAGKLELDAPIDRYLRSPLPRSRFDTGAVTLRLLGGHAAGLPGLFEMFDQTSTPPKIGDLIRDYGELAYPAGESKCIVGNESARPIRELTIHSNKLTFSVDGGLSATATTDGERQLDFKLIARSDVLVGRCLSSYERPGFTSTEPHIVALSRSS